MIPRSVWLFNAHKTLDAVLAAACGWTDYTPDMSNEEILRRLPALNLARKSAEAPSPPWRQRRLFPTRNT